MAAPMVDYNHSFAFQHSSPLDTLARRTSSRKGVKPLAPQPLAAPVPDSQSQYLSSYTPNVTTPPRRQLQQQNQLSPPSPLLHTQFRTSTVSYDTRNSFLDSSISSMHGKNESQEIDFSYQDDDASVYSRPSMLPSPHPQDRHGPDSPDPDFGDAYSGTADPDPPSIGQSSNSVSASQESRPESSLPTVVISTVDALVPAMQPTRGSKVAIAAPTKFNFSRPGRPPTLPPEDLKRHVLERNTGRHPPQQRDPSLMPHPPNPIDVHPSEAGSSSTWIPNVLAPISHPPDSSLNAGHVNRHHSSSSPISDRLNTSSQHPYQPDFMSFSEQANTGTSEGMYPYQVSRPDPFVSANPLYSQAPQLASIIPFGHAERERLNGSPHSQPTDGGYRVTVNIRGSPSPTSSGNLMSEKTEENQSGRVKEYGSSYTNNKMVGGVGEEVNTDNRKQTRARATSPQEIPSTGNSSPSHSLDSILPHDPSSSTWDANSYSANSVSRNPNESGSPLSDYPNYSPSSSVAISRPSTSTVTSTTSRPTIELSRGPPPRAVSPAASLYSQYSFYQLDSKSPSPTGSASRHSPDPAGLHSPSDQTLLSPTYTPPTRSPAPSSRSPSAASTISPAIPSSPHTPHEYLQLGIQHHEANRLKDSAMCFEKSAKEGGGCGVGMVMWGLTLRHGWGCEKNERLGFKWLQKAAESAVVDLEGSRQGLDVNAVRDELVIAIYEVGQCFFQGWGVRKDLKMAVSYYTVAARLGDADAQQDLGFCLANGKGCKKDRKEAAKWYRAAIAQGASDVGMAWVYKEKLQ